MPNTKDNYSGKIKCSFNNLQEDGLTEETRCRCGIVVDIKIKIITISRFKPVFKDNFFANACELL